METREIMDVRIGALEAKVAELELKNGHDDDVWEVRFILKRGRIAQLEERRVPVDKVKVDKPHKARRELTPEEKRVIRQRLVDGKAKKAALTAQASEASIEAKAKADAEKDMAEAGKEAATKTSKKEKAKK